MNTVKNGCIYIVQSVKKHITNTYHNVCESTHNTPGKLIILVGSRGRKGKNQLQTSEKGSVNELHNTQEKHYILLQENTVLHNTQG